MPEAVPSVRKSRTKSFPAFWKHAYADHMRWTINEIETFLSVMDTGSISETATRAGLSKSVISKRISDLEAALGVALFTRHAGRISATNAASALAERIRPAYSELVAATEWVAEDDPGLHGRLRISAPMSFGIRHVGRIAAKFSSMHPNLEVIIEYDDAMVDLARSGFDAAVRVGAMPDSTLVVRKLCEDPRVIVASPGYLEQHGPIDSPDQLRDHAAIGYQNKRLGEIWQFDKPVDPPAPSRVMTNNGEAMRDMVLEGLGIALLPMFIVYDDLKNERLLQVLPELTPEPLPVQAVWPPIKHMPPKLRLFIDHLALSFGQRAPWQ
ncbi:LysR family transcriptional regulator [Leisingera sp. ANG59]|uniref:LysR family transcriptional regulator n=1 Tax=Leisingera sp. ANG59 TaxID=2675221 RepID=UPI0020C719B1|nr:LysR family transcriptional regulator [Leisingera sp. ANG59]